MKTTDELYLSEQVQANENRPAAQVLFDHIKQWSAASLVRVGSIKITVHS